MHMGLDEVTDCAPPRLPLIREYSFPQIAVPALFISGPSITVHIIQLDYLVEELKNTLTLLGNCDTAN